MERRTTNNMQTGRRSPDLTWVMGVAQTYQRKGEEEAVVVVAADEEAAFEVIRMSVMMMECGDGANHHRVVAVGDGGGGLVSEWAAGSDYHMLGSVNSIVNGYRGFPNPNRQDSLQQGSQREFASVNVVVAVVEGEAKGLVSAVMVRLGCCSD
jgi:hypothetical protein